VRSIVSSMIEDIWKIDRLKRLVPVSSLIDKMFAGDGVMIVHVLRSVEELDGKSPNSETRSGSLAIICSITLYLVHTDGVYSPIYLSRPPHMLTGSSNHVTTLSSLNRITMDGAGSVH